MNARSSFILHPSSFDMARRPKQRRPSLDLEEIAPSRFFIHNQQIRWLLKGEGTFSGPFFELSTWRREGLLARLRERGFDIRTLGDLAAALPAPPADPPPIGGVGWRPLASALERVSHFDLRNMRWRSLAPERRDGVEGVAIYSGWVLRRRKGRGPASYYIGRAERAGGVGLQPIDETKAILIGYAQALELDNRPLLAERHDDKILLPDVDLPPPHRALIQRFGIQHNSRLLVDEQMWPLAQEIFGRLGVLLRIDDYSIS
jgi:hypothetical protein